VSCECGNIINPHAPKIPAGAMMTPLNVMTKIDLNDGKNIVNNKFSEPVSNMQPQIQSNQMQQQMQ